MFNQPHSKCTRPQNRVFSCFLNSLLAVSTKKKLKQKWKEALSVVRSLEAKAERRRYNFTEAFDQMFLEKLKTHKVPRRHLDSYHVKRADDFVNPGDIEIIYILIEHIQLSVRDFETSMNFL